MAATVEQLEEIIRSELREPVEEIVRRVVVELVREQLNGHAAEMPAGPDLAANEATNGVSPATESPPAADALTRRQCKDCEQTLALDQFEPHRFTCRRCRREQHRRRQQAAATADEGLANQLD